ncbi:MAG: hypothetical protein AMXMBFR84_34070 [Candidatus Hydrogenedentota bacterium]
MTKRELVIEVAERLGYTQNEVSACIQTTLDTIVDCLSEGQRLEIRNFGVFEVKERDARMGRNPRTGEEVPISEKRVATFKPGKALKEWVQSGVAPVDLHEDDAHYPDGSGASSAEGSPQTPHASSPDGRTGELF